VSAMLVGTTSGERRVEVGASAAALAICKKFRRETVIFQHRENCCRARD
jgi:hypothetical protein